MSEQSVRYLCAEARWGNECAGGPGARWTGGFWRARRQVRRTERERMFTTWPYGNRSRHWKKKTWGRRMIRVGFVSQRVKYPSERRLRCFLLFVFFWGLFGRVQTIFCSNHLPNSHITVVVLVCSEAQTTALFDCIAAWWQRRSCRQIFIQREGTNICMCGRGVSLLDSCPIMFDIGQIINPLYWFMVFGKPK